MIKLTPKEPIFLTVSILLFRVDYYSVLDVIGGLQRAIINKSDFDRLTSGSIPIELPIHNLSRLCFFNNINQAVEHCVYTKLYNEKY